jgi:hypothetical protein
MAWGICESACRKIPQSHPAVARPVRALFMLLNQPEASTYGTQRIAEHAEASVRVIQLGLAAIGNLLAQSAVQVEGPRRAEGHPSDDAPPHAQTCGRRIVFVAPAATALQS